MGKKNQTTKYHNNNNNNNNNNKSDEQKALEKFNPSTTTTTTAKRSLSGITFPDQIVIEILTRLPVKSLLRFRSVCKLWKSIVDDSSFVDLHLNQSKTQRWGARILISFSNFDGSKHYFYSSSLEGGKAVPLLSLPGCNKGSRNSSRQCHVSESINGLICFYNGSEVYICNPSTKSIIALPASSETHRYSKLDSFLNTHYSNYSFGFDPVTNEYKVLHVLGLRQGVKLHDVQCEVRTIRAGPEEPEELASLASWRKISRVPPYPYIFRSSGVCVNGAIHWMGMTAPCQGVIVVFDVGSEKFHLISLPNGFSSSTSSLTQIGGSLALLGYKDGDSHTIELWVLEDYHNLVWIKESFFYPQNQKKLKSPILVGNGYTGDLLLIPSSLQNQYYGLIHRHQKDKALKTIRVDGLPPWTDLFGAKNINFSVSNHVESFVPLPQILQFGEFVVRTKH